MGSHGLLRTAMGVSAALALVVCAALFIPACGVDPPTDPAAVDQTTLPQADPSLPARVAVMEASDADVAEAAASSNAFSLDLFRSVRPENDNMVCSPYSAFLALTMTMAGAKGETQNEMKQMLHITLPDQRLYPAINDLDHTLVAGGGFACANSIWGQTGRTFKEPFVDLVGHYYGASLRLLDMDGDYAGACETVNDWVSEKTAGRIAGLMSPDDKPDTPLLMMLVNAVHFKARWQQPFWRDDGQAWPSSFPMAARRTSSCCDGRTSTGSRRSATWRSSNCPMRTSGSPWSS